MKIRETIAGLIVTVLLTGIAAAGAIPGRWEKIEAQTPGAGLTITLKSGPRISAFFKSLDSSALVVQDTVSGEKLIPRDEIRRIETMGTVADPVSDGVAIGLLIGIGLGGLSAYLSDEDGSRAAGFALNAGLGALFGFLIDNGTKGPEVLYKAR